MKATVANIIRKWRVALTVVFVWILTIGIVILLWMQICDNVRMHVYGRVCDDQGRPIPNVVITAYFSRIYVPPILVMALPLSGGGQFTVRTDSDGRFHLNAYGDQLLIDRFQKAGWIDPGQRDRQFVYAHGTLVESTRESSEIAPIEYRMIEDESSASWTLNARPVPSGHRGDSASFAEIEPALLERIKATATDEVLGRSKREGLREQWYSILSNLTPDRVRLIALNSSDQATRWAMLELATRCQIEGLDEAAIAGLDDHPRVTLSGWRYLAFCGRADSVPAAVAKARLRYPVDVELVRYAGAYVYTVCQGKERDEWFGKLETLFRSPGHVGSMKAGVGTFEDVSLHYWRSEFVPYFVEDEQSFTKHRDEYRHLGVDVSNGQRFSGGSIYTKGPGSQVILVRDPNRLKSLDRLTSAIRTVEAKLVKDTERKVISPMVWETVIFLGGTAPEDIALDLPLCGLRLKIAGDSTTALHSTVPATGPSTPEKNDKKPW